MSNENPTIKLPRTTAKGIFENIEAFTPSEWRHIVSIDPAVPRDNEQCIALARRIYLGRTQLASNNIINNQALLAVCLDEFCSPSHLQNLLIIGLKNPHLTENGLVEIDRLIDTVTPFLPETFSTPNFEIKFTTTDANPLNNITTTKVQAYGNKLEALYSFFGEMGFRPPKGNWPSIKVPVRIYYIASSTGHADILNGIFLSSSAINDNVNYINQVVAQELFHTIQYAYGMRTRHTITHADQWAVEGSANAAAGLANGDGSTASAAYAQIHHINTMIDNTNIDPMTLGYNALPMFIFLMGGNNDKRNYRNIESFMSFYALSGDFKSSFERCIQKSTDNKATNISYYVNNLYLNMSAGSIWYYFTGTGHIRSLHEFVIDFIDYWSGDYYNPNSVSSIPEGKIYARSASSAEHNLIVGGTLIFSFEIPNVSVSESISCSINSLGNRKLFMSVALLDESDYIISYNASSKRSSLSREIKLPVTGFHAMAKLKVIITDDCNQGPDGNGRINLTVTRKD